MRPAVLSLLLFCGCASTPKPPARVETPPAPFAVHVPASWVDKKIAILPVSNKTEDPDGSVIFREMMRAELSSGGFRLVREEFVDEELKAGRIPDADALFHSEILTYKFPTAEAHAWLVDTNTGKKLWDATWKRSNMARTEMAADNPDPIGRLIANHPLRAATQDIVGLLAQDLVNHLNAK